MRLRRAAILGLGLLLAGAAPAMAITVPPDLLAAARAYPGAELALTRDPIEVSLTGTAPLDFTAAVAVLSRENVLQDLQDTYASTLPAGTEAEFVIHRQGPNSYFYVNRYGQRSEVTELARRCRGTSPARFLAADYYITSVRFFGPFHAVVHLVLTEGSPGKLGYNLHVYAYPERSTARFLGRHLGLVRHFFRSKSEEMVTTVTRLFTDLGARQEPQARRTDLAPDGAGPTTCGEEKQRAQEN